MKFFIDTGSVQEIREAAELAVLDGVTTNPSLLAKEKGNPFEILKEICNIVPGPVSAEVIATDTAGMLKEAGNLVKIADNIVIKLPTTKEGVKACKVLSSEGVKVNMTLVFSPNQALIVAKAGAAYVSPFIGRLDDISSEGMQLISQVGQIYANYGYETEILVASVRHPMHVVEAALLGADVCTIPAKVLHQMFQHPLTDIGLEKFLSDWKKANG
ncbi:MAG: fructose-6-phosphate aldolase [Calditrichaceae bacterium]|nr:fructose-6-phosphate aldolase [Calditrichia bacterium]NUQ43840.1 fructose-6-phosphate aldolase [Calditrichaceae bacterium]